MWSRYTEMQQPPNFLFVRCVMVKIPRTGRQRLDTADPQCHIKSRCSTSSQHQSSCSLACFQSVPNTNVTLYLLILSLSLQKESF